MWFLAYSWERVKEPNDIARYLKNPPNSYSHLSINMSSFLILEPIKK